MRDTGMGPSFVPRMEESSVCPLWQCKAESLFAT